MGSEKSISDPDWGLNHHDYVDLHQEKVRVCLVSVKEIEKLAYELTAVVTDSSWIVTLDAGTRRAYENTVKETAGVLVKIFEAVNPNSPIAADFGEVMVSMGAARALEVIFRHKTVPLAELWKPQLKQNEGFDFHTECPTPLINFGEAKYSAAASPHGLAINQAGNFLKATKHLRDRPHLISVCSAEAVRHLDDDRLGVVVAFSVNGKDRDLILSNARDSAMKIAEKYALEQVFVVGVVRES